jgi:copper transport protein
MRLAGRIRGALATVAIAVGVVAAVALAPGDAAAHALLLSSTPAAGTTVGTSPAAIELTFGETPDPKLSSAKVLDASGSNHASGPAVPAPGKPLTLDVPVGPLADGVYTVTWRTVSSVDGHVAAGSFAFGVGVPVTAAAPASQSQGSSPSASLLADAARWLLYLGLVALFGAAFFGYAIDPQVPRSVLRLAGVGWLVAALGALGVTAVQWSDAGGDIGGLLGTSVGTSAIARIAAIVIAGLLAAVLVLRRASPSHRLFGLVAASAAVAMFVDVATGHAAAGTIAPFQVLTQWLHIASAGLWIGGLAALLLTVRGAPDDAKAGIARRYATWAGIGLATVALTGVIRAVSEIGSIDALVSTDYGRVVLIKSALLAFLALLGASNHYINIPAAARRLTGLRRVGSTELALGGLVLGLSALLVNLAPPVSSAGTPSQPAAAPIIATGHDFGTTVKLRLVVSPGAPGFNKFEASVTDFDSGAPVAATAVSLRFAVASSTGVGGSTLALQPAGSGSFSASGGNLSLDGIWNIVATVAAPSGAVEVPLVASTVGAPQPVDGDGTPLAPATVHLADGTSVQVYLDPGGPGANELHATFFDAAGKELPVPTATMAVLAQDGSALIAASRQLEPGHFVADIQLAGGPIAVDIAGIGATGGVIHAHLVIKNA